MNFEEENSYAIYTQSSKLTITFDGLPLYREEKGICERRRTSLATPNTKDNHLIEKRKRDYQEMRGREIPKTQMGEALGRKNKSLALLRCRASLHKHVGLDPPLVNGLNIPSHAEGICVGKSNTSLNAEARF